LSLPQRWPVTRSVSAKRVANEMEGEGLTSSPTLLPPTKKTRREATRKSLFLRSRLTMQTNMFEQAHQSSSHSLHVPPAQKYSKSPLPPMPQHTRAPIRTTFCWRILGRKKYPIFDVAPPGPAYTTIVSFLPYFYSNTQNLGSIITKIKHSFLQ